MKFLFYIKKRTIEYNHRTLSTQMNFQKDILMELINSRRPNRKFITKCVHRHSIKGEYAIICNPLSNATQMMKSIINSRQAISFLQKIGQLITFENFQNKLWISSSMGNSLCWWQLVTLKFPTFPQTQCRQKQFWKY